MTIKPNIGILNALIRITLGFTFLSWTTAKLVKRPWRDSYLVVGILAAMKIAEGIVRFCPLTALIENWGDSCQENKSHGQTSDMDTESILPYNPT